MVAQKWSAAGGFRAQKNRPFATCRHRGLPARDRGLLDLPRRRLEAWFDQLAPASEDEEEYARFCVRGLTHTSRLAPRIA